MTFLNNILENLNKYKSNTAFYISDHNYTYLDLQQKITGIKIKLEKIGISKGDIVIIEIYNDIETYSSILALWTLGAAFVPLNPKHPKERNKRIRKQINTKYTISSNTKTKAIHTKNLISDSDIKISAEINKNNLLYILFTSGSTGIPKGVQITHGNLSSFLSGTLYAGYNLSADDRFLQIYDLTFDASFAAWVLPLFIGASVYTVNPNKPKYLEAYKIMEKHKITFAKLTPAVLSYLSVYFSKINLPHLRYNTLGGEGLSLELAKLWSACIPNAEIHNVYGPTETTINTHIFKLNFQKDNSKKTYNGNLSIGKTHGKNIAIITDAKQNILPKGEKGELCISGEQISPGYFNDEAKNKKAFVKIHYKNKLIRFYCTGDSAYIDNNDDFIFCGRIDNQVQINGYRVELGEIEHIANKFGNALNYTAVTKKNKIGISEIYLFAEQLTANRKNLIHFLKQNLPQYMIPNKIINLENFPHTAGGKISINELKKIV